MGAPNTERAWVCLRWGRPEPVQAVQLSVQWVSKALYMEMGEGKKCGCHLLATVVGLKVGAGFEVGDRKEQEEM